MAEKPCSFDTCNEIGELVCSGCKGTSYCSKVCQKAHWKTHKNTCLGARAHKCYLIRAPPNGVIGDVSTHIEPFDLRRYGDESGEKEELKERLGWTKPSEAGKFYDHVGSDQWYYWVYGDDGAKACGKPLNVLSRRLCDRDFYGDLVVLRSGPSGATYSEYGDEYGDLVVLQSGPSGATYSEQFTRSALAKTVEFYETESRSNIFGLREKSRAGKRWGVDLSRVPASAFSSGIM